MHCWEKIQALHATVTDTEWQ